ncbi:MAG: hypothetical protein JRI59_11940 [Deltaproteobacteria bacterium]|nr:hypothetical protein [Deltaproteobacteria bacterium]
MTYAIYLQGNRRNQPDAEILRCIEALNRRKRQGYRTDLAPNDAKLDKEKFAQETAKLVGISPRKVEQTRTVLDHAEELVKEAVKAG